VRMDTEGRARAAEKKKNRAVRDDAGKRAETVLKTHIFANEKTWRDTNDTKPKSYAQASSERGKKTALCESTRSDPQSDTLADKNLVRSSKREGT